MTGPSRGRRLVLAAAALCASSAPLGVEAQQAARMPRIGFLSPSRRPANEEVFWQELGRLGYVDGKSITVEYRSSDGNFERLPDLAAELVALDVDLIVTYLTQASVAAKRATATIPIVMIAVSDPVASGLVASLARPGGNVTGTSTLSADVVGKQLELVRELLPGVSLAAALWNPANRVFQQQQLEQASAAAGRLRMQLKYFDARTPDEIDRAFPAMSKERAAVLVVLGDPLFASHARRIADLAVRHRLPTVSATRPFAEAGVMATYGPDFADAYRRAAAYVDRILKGAKPADLPVEQPTKFELIINAKTARTLGFSIPPSLVARADLIIE